MPANFANLRFLYTHEKTGYDDLKLVFKLSSLNFDINTTTIGPSAPFTSEMIFDVKLEKDPASNIKKLQDLSKALKDHFDYDDGKIVSRMTQFLKEQFFTSENFQLNYYDIQDWTLNTVDDGLFSSRNLTKQITEVKTSGQDIFNFLWNVKIKFPTTSHVDNNSVVLIPQLDIPSLAITSPDNSESVFNSELSLNYELLYQPIVFTDPDDPIVITTSTTNTQTDINEALAQSSSDELVNSIGKATDEITDSISSLTNSLNANLSTTFTTRLTPPGNFESSDLALWVLIKKGTDALSFKNFDAYMQAIFCGKNPENASEEQQKNIELNRTRSLPFMNIDAYRCVKIAAEAFVMVNCMVDEVFTDKDIQDLLARVPLINGVMDSTKLDKWWADYKVVVTGADGDTAETIPYLAVIQSKLQDENIKLTPFGPAFETYIGNNTAVVDNCFGILSEKLSHPCFLELIWSYWHEESMLIQGFNAISRRFQNVKAPGRDPLANIEIDPLRPLNNLMWGYIQDEQHRLTVRRRAYEYNHHYGISLKGAAAKNMRFADSRSKFIEAFHRLLNVVSQFYRQADDMTVQPDGFPVLNALKEVHLILSEGAHNQYGDLPSVSRAEMLMQQWLLARPEFREFLPTRIMVAYPERWMDRVSALNNLMGWTKTSPIHFRDLGRFGEQLLLSIRFGNWANINDRRFASNWASYWREQIQGYTHAYRAVTGVDLSLEVTSGNGQIDAQQPSAHLYRRLRQQRNSK